MKRATLASICKYADAGTEIDNITLDNYISTENMLPNKCGITQATSLPSCNKVKAYSEGNVLVSNIRPYFKKIWFATNNGGCSNDVLVFRANENTDSKFLYYLLADDNFFNFSTATSKGTKMPRGDKKAIMQYEAPIFDIAEQKAIAAVLSALDDKIEVNRAINKNLEEYANTVYQTFFSQKSDIKGKVVTLDEYCSIFTGKRNANDSVNGGKYPFFTCSPDTLTIDSYIYDGNAIIISGNGSYTGRTRFYSGKFDLYQRTYACTLMKYANPDYIFALYWFIKLELSKRLMGGTRGSAIPYIVMNDLAKFEFIHNESVFNSYVPVFKNITKMILHNETENQRLAAIRDALLPKLMSGEIDVSQVKI